MKAVTNVLAGVSVVLSMFCFITLMIFAEDMDWLHKFKHRMESVTEIHLFPQREATQEEPTVEIR